MNNIPITDQWKLDGECGKCRRANYCSKDCRPTKNRKKKIAQQAYFDFLEESRREADAILEKEASNG